MLLKYIFIFGLISILKIQVESKIEFQRRNNVLLSLSPANAQQISIGLPKNNNRAINVDKSRKKIAIHKPFKLLNEYYGSSKKTPVYTNESKSKRQHKISSEINPIYSYDLNVDEKYQESSNFQPIYIKSSPKINMKHLKSSKKLPMQKKRKTIKKKHSKSLKEIEKKNLHPSKIDKNHEKSVETPSIYLKPPEIDQNSQYRTHKRRGPLKKVILKKKSRKPSNSATDYLNGEENRQEKYQHYVRDHEPVRQASEESNNDNNDNNDNNNNDYDDDSQKENNYVGENFLSNNNRVDFHIHGHEGPKSYVFGFDTGKGDNRQFRYEQKHKNGTVTGQYGYYDPRGKFKKIFYRSDPFLGYQQSILDEEFNAKNLIDNENE